MCRLIESIKIDHLGVQNLGRHEHRLNESRKILFNLENPISLEKYIQVPRIASALQIKCRVIYEREILKIEYITYSKNIISHLKIVYDDDISYSFKYENRNNLNKLLAQKGDCDDVLIIRKGRVTDTSYCNIVFFDGENWITPKFPLLEGTMRASLLESGKVIENDIRIEDVLKYEKFKLINAMFGFNGKEYPIENLVH